MRTVQDWLNAYGESHQNLVNKKIHWVCVPLIMFSLLGLLWILDIPIVNQFKYFNAATLLIALVSLYYFKLSLPMGVGMLLISFIMIYIIIQINTSSLIPYIIIFIVAWIGQFIGHKIEGKKPSFFEDLQFLLIGPLWILSQAYDLIGIKY